MRLIDADVVEDVLKKCVNNSYKRRDIQCATGVSLAVLELRNIPTAYDVEKVVAKMKERVENFDCIKCKHYDDEKYVCNTEMSCRDYTFKCLYDIVRKGGAE